MSKLLRPNIFQKTINPVYIIHRTMVSVAPPAKYEWMVIIPDRDGALEMRMKVRPAHFEGLKPSFEAGFWKMGGALLDEIPAEGAPLKINGSAMIAFASSKEEVMAQLKKDIYAENDVWDFSKIQIFPFKCAFRKEA